MYPLLTVNPWLSIVNAYADWATRMIYAHPLVYYVLTGDSVR